MAIDLLLKYRTKQHRVSNLQLYIFVVTLSVITPVNIEVSGRMEDEAILTGSESAEAALDMLFSHRSRAERIQGGDRSNFDLIKFIVQRAHEKMCTAAKDRFRHHDKSLDVGRRHFVVLRASWNISIDVSMARRAP